MPKPKIFISHSAKPELEPAAYAKLRTIYDALVEEGYDVLLDLQRLEAGDDWRETLNTWLALAAGAVVLVSRQARDASQWVARETNMLTWRGARDPKFVLVPVTVQPVDKGGINRGLLAGSGLDRKQALAAEDPEVLTKLLERLEHLKREAEAEAPMRQIEERIAEILSAVDHASLRRAAAALDPALHEWSPAADTPHVVARLFLRATLDEACEVIRDLRSLSDEAWAELIELLAPSWIDFRAAEPIARIAKGPPAGRCVAINGQNVDTLRMYIWRASGRPQRGGWPCADVNAVPRENPAPNIVRQILDHFLSRNKRLSEKALKATLSNEDNSVPVLALLPEDAPRQALKQIRDELKGITFFMLTSDIPSFVDLGEVEKNVCTNSGAYFLVPSIVATVEVEALKKYWQAQLILCH